MHLYTMDTRKKEMLSALQKSLGVVTSACEKCSISRQAHYNWIKSDPEYAAAVDDIKERSLDFGESHLHKLIQAGNPAATIFFLKTKAKDRGYVERASSADDKILRPRRITPEEKQEMYDKLLVEWSQFKRLEEPDFERVRIMADVKLEIARIQEFVDEHGSTYLVEGKSGDKYYRQRPEYQQLQELRLRMDVLIDKMQKDAIPEQDQLTGFFSATR